MSVVSVGEFYSDEGATYACVDKSGNEIVPSGKYYQISDPNSEGFAIVAIKVDDGYRYGLIDNTGKEVLPCQYDAADYNGETTLWYNEGMAQLWRDSKLTVADRDGRVILQDAKYDEVVPWDPVQDLMRVRYNGKTGYIDRQTGEEAIPCEYEDASDFGNGYIAVCLDEKWGMITTTGEEVVPCIYDDWFSFAENAAYAKVSLNGEEKIIDRSGKAVTKYDGIQHASSGVQGVHTTEGWGTVDSTGKEIVPCQYDSVYSERGYVVVTVYGEDGYGKEGLFDGEGNEILPAEYSLIKVISDTLVAVNIGGVYYGKWGFLYLGDKSAAPTTTAYASTQKVLVDGKTVEFQCYALRDASGNDTNYIKLRDMAAILNGSAAQFNVNYDGSIVIETKKPYTTANGTEMNTPFSGDREYKANTDVTKIDGVASDLAAITLTDDAGGGYTYYKLRDLGQALGFNVGWDNVKGNIFVETDKPYDPNN